MQIRLEIFPNLAVYQVHTKESQVELPVAIQNVTAFTSTLKSVPIILVKNQPFSKGQRITVNGEEGILIGFNHDSVDIIRDVNEDDKIIRIHRPKRSVVSGSYSKQYQLQTDKPSLVTGFLPDVRWMPQYNAIINKTTSELQKITLVAQVQANNSPFHVDQIIFNTRPVIAELHQERALAFTDASTTTELGVDTQYFLNESLTVQEEMSFPLASYDRLQIPQKYFLTLQEGASPEYGYILSLETQIPKGIATIYNDDLSVLGRSPLQIYGDTIIMKVAPAEDLLSTTIIERSQTQIQFQTRITSNMNNQIQMILELPVFDSIQEIIPPTTCRLPGLVLWSVQVNPGQNFFEGRVTFSDDNSTL